MDTEANKTEADRHAFEETTGGDWQVVFNAPGVENADGAHYFHWENDKFPPITKGRIGLRQMFTRSACYKNFRISQPR
jgi:hypothetical protein